VALVMIDLNGLKGVNDAAGHQAGDRLIKSVAAALRDNARGGDGVYRVGGDEFAAVLPGAAAWDAFDFTQRLHAVLAAGRASVSAGVAATATGGGRGALIAAADAALITAKRTGRATVIHTAGMVAAPGASAPDLRQQSALASALARAVDAKDSWTRSHCETVAELCALIATGLGLDADRVEELRLAGLVHDVGKIGVPDAILQKPAALDEAEYATVKAHATLGHKILSGTELTREAFWVLHHHERIDGGGYPHGLRGDRIPLESRIIHVADAFEAMTSDRPYRRGMPEIDAIAELRRHAGTQFDPVCVDALVAALDAGAAVRAAAPATPRLAA
jgi:diguanylate cyclase (GGDEF)-like protein